MEADEVLDHIQRVREALSRIEEEPNLLLQGQSEPGRPILQEATRLMIDTAKELVRITGGETVSPPTIKVETPPSEPDEIEPPPPRPRPHRRRAHRQWNITGFPYQYLQRNFARERLVETEAEAWQIACEPTPVSSYMVSLTRGPDRIVRVRLAEDLKQEQSQVKRNISLAMSRVEIFLQGKVPAGRQPTAAVRRVAALVQRHSRKEVASALKKWGIRS